MPTLVPRCGIAVPDKKQGGIERKMKITSEIRLIFHSAGIMVAGSFFLCLFGFNIIRVGFHD